MGGFWGVARGDFRVQNAYSTLGLWYPQAVASRFGENMDGGRCVAACALPCGAFMVANDAVVSGPLTLDVAWARLNSEPFLLIYTRGRPPAS